MCYYGREIEWDWVCEAAERAGYVLVKEEAVDRAMAAGLITDNDIW